jgi:RNA polymerase sigma-70 factor (ECF subfamily)
MSDTLTRRLRSEADRDGCAEQTERFLEHFAEHHQRILAHIFSLLPNQQDANDVFQKTSLVLWRKFDCFDEDRDFLAWACGVAHYEVRNFLRVAGRDRLRFNDELLKTLSDRQLRRSRRSQRRAEALAECVDRLARDQRELVREAYGGQQTIKQIAERIGRAPQTVYNRLNRIRRRLTECVEWRLAQSGN